MKRRGFTLIEMVSAAFLFALLGLIAFAVLKWGVGGWGYGKVRMEAQQNARKMTDVIKSELATGARVNVLRTNNPPPVIRPQPNGASELNEVVFFGANRTAKDMDTSNIANFKLVRYAAINMDSTPPDANALIREEYTMVLNGDAIDGLTASGTSNPDFTIDYSKMTRTKQDVLIHLKPRERLTFTVAHTALDYRTYSVDVTVTQHLNGDPTQKAAVKQIKDSVTLADMM